MRENQGTSESRLLRGVHRTLTGLHPALESLLAAVVGMAVGAILMRIWGYNPWKAYAALFRGAYGSAFGRASSLARGVPLVFTAMTFAICMRAGMFNIGAEGQVFLGAAAAITVAFFHLPPGLHLIVGLVFAMIAGAAWSIGPALLKVTRGVHEVISTIMFNWIARFLVFFLVTNVLVDPRRAEKTFSIPVSARFPVLVSRTDLSYSIFLAIAFALVIYFVLWHTVVGYEIRAAGLNPTAARYGGINSKRTILLSFILGGIGAGLAGASIVMGQPPTYAMFSGLPMITNTGFDGMAVAMVGRNHPIGILVAAVFFGGLTAGGRTMQIFASTPLEVVRVVTGVIVITMAIPELLRIFPRTKGELVKILALIRKLRQKRASQSEESP